MEGHDIIKKEDGTLKFIEATIAKARKAFRKKNFKTSLEIYSSIGQEDTLSDIDKQVIVFCSRNCAEDCNGDSFALVSEACKVKPSICNRKINSKTPRE
jgi:hypothetical protein